MVRDMSPAGASGNRREDQSSIGGGVGGRFILVQWGPITKRFDLIGSFKALRDRIISTLRLSTKQDFWLEDEHGTLCPLDRDMVQGTYKLNTVHARILDFCYVLNPNHNSCALYRMMLVNQEDLANFLGGCHLIGLRRPGDNQIIDQFEDIQTNITYHGLVKM